MWKNAADLLFGAATFGLLALAAPAACAAELEARTLNAFESYMRAAEARLQKQNTEGPFLWADASPARLRELRQGKTLAEPWSGKGDVEIPDGLIHDWVGAVFVPGATLQQTLALVEDYNNHKNIYKPEVVDSKLLTHNGNEYKIYLRLLKKKVITVLLETDHDVRYFRPDDTRCYSQSYSTRIAEVADAGKPGERRLPAGRDHGFLWRLNSFWRFEERDGGVYVECEAISLTRDVPTGLGWLINPMIRSLPRESLANTLNDTRQALMRRQ